MRITRSEINSTHEAWSHTAGGIASARSTEHRRQSDRDIVRDRKQAYDRAIAELKSKMELVVPYERSGSQETDSFIRSEITKNFRDESGWRDPSPYQASWHRWQRVIRSKGPYAYFKPKYSEGYWIGYYSNCLLEGRYGYADFDGFLTLPFHRGPSSNVENRLLANCLSQLRNQKFDLALSILESRETFKTLADQLKRLRTILKAVRKKDLRTLKRAFGFDTKNRDAGGVYTKSSSSLWLEVMYGLRPILYDIYGLCELAESQFRKAGFRIKVTSHQTYADQETIRPTSKDPLGIFTTGTVSLTHNVTQKVSLWYELDGENLHFAEALGLTNPALWVWEKTTLSFVVDWLLPVGDVLAGLTSDLGFKYLGGTHTYYVQSIGQGEVGTRSGLSRDQYESINADDDLKALTGPSECGRMVRTVYKTSPKPGFYVKDPFSVNNAVTTIALIGSAFAKTR